MRWDEWLALAVIVWLGLMLWSDGAFGHHTRNKQTDKYDLIFQRSVKRYFPPELKRDWALLKSQCWVESRLKPHAESWAKARGICQLLPTTFSSVADAGESIWNPKSNIKAAARFDRRLWVIWGGRKRHTDCHARLMLSSFNAGPGHIISAQRLADDALCWNDISRYLVNVTGPRNSRETLDYVDRITAACRRFKCRSLASL